MFREFLHVTLPLLGAVQWRQDIQEFRQQVEVGTSDRGDGEDGADAVMEMQKRSSHLERYAPVGCVGLWPAGIAMQYCCWGVGTMVDVKPAVSSGLLYTHHTDHIPALNSRVFNKSFNRTLL